MKSENLTEMELVHLLPAFPNPVLNSQRAFRRILEALAHPGRTVTLGEELSPPTPLNRATAAVCLTLIDLDTKLWVDFKETDEAIGWLYFHCGCPITASPGSARFALITDERTLPLLEGFYAGHDEAPETSATLIIQTSGLGQGVARSLLGPGLATAQQLAVRSLPEAFWVFWKANHRIYPLGVDVFLTCGTSLIALPRTTRVEG
jgi:alpha-D-ribose 1-methylphosphonate 5-triphosphate synthase subunit PhnH